MKLDRQPGKPASNWRKRRIAALAGSLLLILAAIGIFAFPPFYEKLLLPIYLQLQMALWYLRSLPDGVLNLLTVLFCGLILLSLGYAAPSQSSPAGDNPAPPHTHGRRQFLRSSRHGQIHCSKTDYLAGLIRKALQSRTQRRNLSAYCTRLLAQAQAYPEDSSAAALQAAGLAVPPDLLAWAARQPASKGTLEALETIILHIEDKAGIHDS
jgi:hypothetical protein